MLILLSRRWRRVWGGDRLNRFLYDDEGLLVVVCAGLKYIHGGPQPGGDDPNLEKTENGDDEMGEHYTNLQDQHSIC